jgi:hypothetical protein
VSLKKIDDLIKEDKERTKELRQQAKQNKINTPEKTELEI